MSKNIKKYFLGISIIIILISIIYFVVPFDHKYSASSLISYVFINIALISQYAFGYMFFYKDSLKSKLYGLPILKTGYIYLTVQTLASLAIIIANAFLDIQPWIPIIIDIVLLGFALIGLITVNAYEETIEEQDNQTKNQTKTWKNIKADIESVMNSIQYDPIRNKVNELYEVIKYSDPVSSDELMEIENEISNEINTLKENLKTNQEQYDIKKIDHIILLVNDRNIKCKGSK